MNLAEISLQGVLTIPHSDYDLIEADKLSQALGEAVQSGTYKGNAQKAETVLKTVTKKELSDGELNQFLNGWRSTHVTALYVSGLMIRIQREAFEALCKGETAKAEALGEAAYHIGEIIAEDTGVEGSNHHNLFDRFAKGVSNSDEWKLDRHEVPECMKFRRFIAHQRTRAPIEEAILTTAASENWNTGEYTFFSGIAPQWLESSKGYSKIEARRTAAYVTVHSGATELNHFTHALKAWQLYCLAQGMEARPERAQEQFIRYAENVGSAFDAMAVKIGVDVDPPGPPAIRAAFTRAI